MASSESIPLSPHRPQPQQPRANPAMGKPIADVSAQVSVGVAGSSSSTAAQIRAKQEARVFELGCPQTPAYSWNNKPVYDVWKKYSAFLLSKRLLAYSDGAQLLELCEAQAAGQIERKNKALHFWRDRNQFPAPLQAENKLDDFLADVADERATFKQRLVPGQTIVLDGEAPYEWSESDPAT